MRNDPSQSPIQHALRGLRPFLAPGEELPKKELIRRINREPVGSVPRDAYFLGHVVQYRSASVDNDGEVVLF